MKISHNLCEKFAPFSGVKANKVGYRHRNKSALRQERKRNELVACGLGPRREGAVGTLGVN